MALDTLDYSVLVALAVALLAYFSKGVLWAVADDGTRVVSDSRDIAEVVRENKKQYLIFYGSQTGTAEDYAHKYAKELKAKFKLNVMVADLADYDFETLNDLDCIVSFFIATYGEGDFPDQSVPFEEHVSTLSEGDLGNLKYTLFGLGNSTYEFFNGAAQKAYNSLNNAGATILGEFGKGDDGAGTLDEDYLAWKENTLDLLKDTLNLEESDAAFEPSLKLTKLDPGEFDEDKVYLGEPDKSYLTSTDLSKGPFDHAHPYLAPISSSKELFNSKGRSCIHAEFDLSNTDLRYSTGDHLAVWPSNSNEKLEKFLKITNLWEDKDHVIDLKPLDSTVSIPFPTPCTIEAIFRNYKEISGPVSRQTLANLKQFSPNANAKEECDRLSKSKNVFAEEIHAKKYDLADVLELLSGGARWTTLSLEFLIESIPHLQPRYYSISSSNLSEKTTIHITAVVEAEKFEDRTITGVATNLIRNIELEQNKESATPFQTYDLKGPRGSFAPFKLPVHVRKSTFRLPTNASAPVIMIGPGTGVAPFRGFIRDRVAQAQQGKEFGKMILFFGCRNSQEDFLYKEEWPQYAKALGESFEMVNAFSREGKEKVYVQHKLYERKDEIMKLIDAGAFIYVCGDAAKMARDVNDTLCKILAESKNFPEEKAHEILKNFRTLNKYQEDVW